MIPIGYNEQYRLRCVTFSAVGIFGSTLFGRRSRMLVKMSLTCIPPGPASRRISTTLAVSMKWMHSASCA